MGTVVVLEATSRSADGKGITRDVDRQPPPLMSWECSLTTMVEDTTWTAPATMADTTQVFTLTLTVVPSG